MSDAKKELNTSVSKGRIEYILRVNSLEGIMIKVT